MKIDNLRPKKPGGYPWYITAKEGVDTRYGTSMRIKPSDVRLDFPKLPDGGKTPKANHE